MPIAALRALQTVIAEAIGDIERIYDEESKATGAQLDYPSLDEPYYKNGLHTPSEERSEKLSTDKRVLVASALIVSAAGQLSATVHKPWLNVLDTAKSTVLAASITYLEKACIVEILREAGPGGLHAEQIARRVDEIRPDTGNTQGPTDPVHVAHVLRLLATHHWVNELKPDVFANNRLSSFVDTGKSTGQLKASPATKYDETDGVAAFVGCLEDVHASATRLPEWLMTGGHGYAGEKQWVAPFNLAKGTDLGFYEWLELPENGTARVGRFGHGMNATQYWEQLENITDAFPWETLPQDAVVVDVGGGIGSAALALARVFPHLRLVVQDRQEVVALGPQSWGPAYADLFNTGRVTFQAHDFFDPQGAVDVKGLGTIAAPAHVYILRINAGAHSRLLVVDNTPAYACVDEGASSDASATRSLAPEGSPVLANLGKANANGHLVDVGMTVLFNARERTSRELSALALSAGWKVTQVNRAVGSLWAYVTAEPVQVEEVRGI